jgi:type II secretory pathway pseudopilin PulG
MKRRAFSAIEALLSIGVIAVTAGITVPLLRTYQVRNDLNVATDYMLQALRTAQSNARAGKNTGEWGVYTAEGLVFEGDDYSSRIASSDEDYPLPPTISIDGLSEVNFDPVSGRPQTSGEIILTALNGDQRIIAIGEQGTMVATGISATATAGGTGDTGGTSSTGNSSSSVTSGSAGSAGSTGSTGSAGSTGSTGGSAGSTGSTGSNGSTGSMGSAGTSSSVIAGAACDDRFYVEADGTLHTTGRVTATVKALGSDITYGAGGPEVQVTAQWSQNGTTWTNLYAGLDIDGGETETITGLVNGSRLNFRITGSYSSFFRRTYASNDATGHVEVLRNDDRVPNYASFNNQNSLNQYLQDIIVKKNGKNRIAIGAYDAVLLVELGDLNSSSADFQDLVLLVQFTQDPGSCAATVASSSSSTSASAVSSASSVMNSSSSLANARLKFSFPRLVNSGAGNAAKKAFVGPSGTQYLENAWIDLTSNGAAIVDSGRMENVAGLSVQRGDGWVRVFDYGTMASGSNKEIVDANAIFEGVSVTGVRNDGSEDPFDGIVNDSAGGDEVTIADDSQSVLVQMRTTVDNDGVYIYWKQGAPAEGAGAGQGGSNGNDKIQICHFDSGTPNTIMVSRKAWPAHEAHGDHFGTCESDDDADLIPNYQDLCPSTRVDSPRSYLLFWRYGLTQQDSDIFRVGPRQSIGEFNLVDTMGCSCEQLLDVAEGKPGYYFTNLPRLYLQLRSLLDFYVTTARKFGCSRDLLRMIEKNG